mgnify:FL=1|jgi:hypothetical protein|tara:strand:- start:271 stop:1473 length:1203 start_codon:yes stop_codon:yes gene_type:complete
MKQFDYTYSTIGDLEVETTEDSKTGRKIVQNILVNDEPIAPSSRFWTSLYARYGFNSAFFKYFGHDEVFNRISERESNDRMRICIERDAETGDNPSLLAVSNPTKPVVVYDELMDTLESYNGESINYHNGIVESTHVPRAGGNTFDISGDAFQNRFVMNTPVDGYGQPNIYLSLLREVCTNGMVGFAKAFKSTLALGSGADDVKFSIIRALDGFGNDEGFAALRQRFESSVSSWASVAESNSLYQMLVKQHGRKNIGWDGAAETGGGNIEKLLSMGDTSRPMGEGDIAIGSPIIKAFHNMTGDTSRLYGLANLDALSIKRQRTLPVKCRVYDLLNFVSEVATHHAKSEEGARQSQAWLGSLISSEYDMEGTADKFGEFDDFFVEKTVLDGKAAMDLQSVN